MSDDSLDDVVVLEHRGDVSVVRFNRPDRMNALSSAGWLVFEQRMLEADAEPTTGAIVVTGTGRAFCAGGDVSSMAAKQEPAAAEARRRAPARRVRHDGLGLVNTMLEIEKPTLAAAERRGRGHRCDGGAALRPGVDGADGADRRLPRAARDRRR